MTWRALSEISQHASLYQITAAKGGSSTFALTQACLNAANILLRMHAACPFWGGYATTSGIAHQGPKEWLLFIVHREPGSDVVTDRPSRMCYPVSHLLLVTISVHDQLATVNLCP